MFDYAHLAYCDLNEKLVNKLQITQNACICYVLGLRIDKHIMLHYYQLKLLII